MVYPEMMVVSQQQVDFFANMTGGPEGNKLAQVDDQGQVTYPAMYHPADLAHMYYQQMNS